MLPASKMIFILTIHKVNLKILKLFFQIVKLNKKIIVRPLIVQEQKHVIVCEKCVKATGCGFDPTRGDEIFNIFFSSLGTRQSAALS